MLAMLLDDHGIVMYVNPAMLALTGWRREEVIGRSAFEVFVPTESVPAMRAAHRDVLAERPSAWSGRTEIVTRSGERRLTRWSNTVLRGSDGRPTGTAHIGEDVTDFARAQAATRASEERYRRLFNASPLPMWLYDLETLAFVAVNDAAIARYGYSRDAFLAMTIADIRPEADRERLRAALQARRDAGEPRAGAHVDDDGDIWRHRRSDGSIIDVEITSHELDFDGRAVRLVAAHDVTTRFEQQRKIERLSRIRAVMTGISSAMLRSTDRRGLLEEACRVATTEGVFPVAWATEIEPDGNVRIVASAGPSPASLEFLQGALSGGVPADARPTHRATLSGRPYIINDLAKETSLGELREHLVAQGHRSGAAFPLLLERRPIGALVLLARERDFFDEDEIALLQWMASDLSFAIEHLEKSKRLDYLAYYDPLTGIANARLFADRLEQHVHAARQNGTQVCVIVFDIERFTRVNDTLGRAAGDALLHAIAQRFDVRLREPYTFARIAGDTFAVASPRDQEHITTRLRDCVFEVLGEPFEIDAHRIDVEVQAGIALYPADGSDGPTVFQNAESALMLAKANGERTVYFSATMNERIARRYALEQALRAAVARGELVAHYQPRVDLESGALVGAEALVRWARPGHGLVYPGDFIELAEQTGSIVEIGRWMLESVCAQQAAWTRAGLGVVPVAVNLSSAQFVTGDLLDTVRGALARHGLDPAALELELTESTVMEDPAGARSTLAALRKLGVRLALDDFGTGHSSLAHLKRFPFDAIKIDRSFVTDIATNPDDAAIATAIIAMARGLELKVVAEGVETQGQLKYLRAGGCDEMQGNLFSKPVSSARFEEMLRSAHRMDLPRPDATEQRTLLMVDDEPGILAALSRVLRREGYRILTAASGREALELLSVQPVQVILSDQRMPGMSGTELFDVVRRLYPDTVRILLTGYADLAAVTDAVNRGEVFKFFLKPWDDAQLREQLREAFRRCRSDRCAGL